MVKGRDTPVTAYKIIHLANVQAGTAAPAAAPLAGPLAGPGGPIDLTTRMGG